MSEHVVCRERLSIKPPHMTIPHTKELYRLAATRQEAEHIRDDPGNPRGWHYSCVLAEDFFNPTILEQYTTAVDKLIPAPVDIEHGRVFQRVEDLLRAYFGGFR